LACRSRCAARVLTKGAAVADRVHGRAKAQAKEPERPIRIRTPARTRPRVRRDRSAKLNEEAKQLMYANRFDEALALFQRATSSNPRPLLLFNVGIAQYQSGQCDAADAASRT